MTAPGGFTGTTLEVDLSCGTIQKQEVSPDLFKQFIGGLGTCVKLAYDAIVPGTDPCSPEAAFVLGAGPLVGTNMPASSRVYAVARLPQSGTIGWCGAGGMVFGCMLKNAGLDHIIIRGRASEPVYLLIEDDHIEIRDATHLWGTGMDDATDALLNDVGRPAGVLAIGQAAENLVPYSMAFIDRVSTLGRGGFGAVMGSKNLKAVVVRGSRGVSVSDPKTYKKLHNALAKKMKEYKYLKDWQEMGLVKSLPLLDKEDYFKIKKRRIACVSCPIGDKDVVKIPDGEHKGLVACSTSVANLCVPMVYGITDYREAIRLMVHMDSRGLDMYEFFGIMGFAADLVKGGLLTLEENEPEIDIASRASLMAWTDRISMRWGTGRLLADGYRAILDHLGPKAEPFAPYTVKNMLTYVGPRGPLPWSLFGTMELGQAVDPRGPHVGASGSPTYFGKRPLSVFPRHLRRMGVPEEALRRILPGIDDPDGEPKDLKVGRLLKYSQAWFTILGSLGLCARAQINRFYDAESAAGFYEAVTGIPTTRDDLIRRAERVWTLLRMANAREGFTRKEDALPEKWFQDPAFKDYLTEKPVKREDLEQLLEDYYDEHGWDPETGVPTRERLRELCL